jgi:hypothetical protein
VSEFGRTSLAFEGTVLHVTAAVLKEHHNTAAIWTAQCFIPVRTSQLNIYISTLSRNIYEKFRDCDGKQEISVKL